MPSKPRCYIPLPLQLELSSVLTKLNKNASLALSSVLCRFEQKWMCQSHGILQLPCILISTVVLPLHLHLSNGSILEHYDPSIEDVHGLSLELSLGFHLNHIPIYHTVRIMYIFIKKINMKNIMRSTSSRKCNSICNWPYYFKHFKWPTISR